MSNSQQTLIERKDVAVEDTWDLSGLCASETDWEERFNALQEQIQDIPAFKGQLGSSARALYDCLQRMTELEREQDALGTYAHLRTAEDMGNSQSMKRWGRFVALMARFQTASSFFAPEIQAIPDETMQGFLQDPVLTDYRLNLEKILRFKPHILSEKEERLLALSTEAGETASKTFGALTDVDMDFGTIETAEGIKPLTQSSFSSFLISGDRELRARAYQQFYAGFEAHKNTLASLYNGSVQLDVFKARARNYPSARAKALFPDKVPEELYDNLIAAVHNRLPDLHRYYRLRKKVLGLDTLKHYDVYVPLTSSVRTSYSYAEAVDLIIPALHPLGDEYCSTLRKGLTERWVDRYENKGKRSGAFSSGSYLSDPFILMNYKSDVLRDVFTLAHEGGHSMHSWYSARNNSYQDYNYTIFEAEVASTFNEQLLAHKLLADFPQPEMQSYLTGKLVDDSIATIFRQTMFAEYELVCHRAVEGGEPLTVDFLRESYHELLTRYFGPEVEFEDVSDLEGLRIPHFYRAFYVYKYATGLSAAVSLAERVRNGGTQERDDYLSFLKSGGSKYPLESLKAAGVDMSKPEPVDKALSVFAALVDKLEQLL